jgi:transcriptional repressor NrdR
MICPYCANTDTQVLESRALPASDGIRRRRECKKCNKRFTTHEKVVNLDLKVIKKDGHLEDYDREKLMKGVRKACYKREVTEEVMENLVDEIEMKLLQRKTIQIRSSEIGRMVLNRLKKVDELAFMRFASVYMDFLNANDFRQFIGCPVKIINK